MSTIRPEFHTNLVSQLIDDIYYQRSNFYYFLGKIEPWTDEPDPDNTPPNTSLNDSIIRDNILFMKRVRESEVSVVTKRYDWTSGTVYDHWDHTVDQIDSPFFVLTDDYTVYKCLNNNNGAPSTVKPTGTLVNPFETADGYLWKYMYTVLSFKRKKFLSAEFIPVQRALTDAFYNRGAIEQVVIDDPGTGYDDITQVALSVSGDGSGAVLIPVISAATGSFLDVIFNNGGSGYTNATISISSIGGTGLYGNPEAVLKPIIYNGEIVRVTIEDPGQAYPPDLSTTIVVQGDGTGASFIPVVVGGQIIDVIVEDPGTNYSVITLTVLGSGSGARLTAVLATSDFLSDQSVVEQSAIPGAIYAINVTNPGNNYTANSTVVIEGDGTGAEAELILNLDGTIEQIAMTNYGSGYTYANVIITDPNRLLPNDFIDAEAYAILPPIGGHGKDAVKELYGDTLSVYTIIQDEFELNLLDQDYRQYGLLVNPTNIFDNKRIITTSNIVTFKATLNTVAELAVDQIIYSDNVPYRVVDIEGSVVELQQLSSIFKSIELGDFFNNPSSPLLEYIVVSVNKTPTVNKYSGNLLYISNNETFRPTQERILSIRTSIKL